MGPGALSVLAGLRCLRCPHLDAALWRSQRLWPVKNRSDSGTPVHSDSPNRTGFSRHAVPGVYLWVRTAPGSSGVSGEVAREDGVSGEVVRGLRFTSPSFP